MRYQTETIVAAAVLIVSISAAQCSENIESIYVVDIMKQLSCEIAKAEATTADTGFRVTKADVTISLAQATNWNTKLEIAVPSQIVKIKGGTETEEKETNKLAFKLLSGFSSAETDCKGTLEQYLRVVKTAFADFPDETRLKDAQFSIGFDAKSTGNGGITIVFGIERGTVQQRSHEVTFHLAAS